ncbi:MAG: hypothetical protein LBS54_00915, partial [Dysgonamonadaceae bacterium]|nr:hypothetical protein [Dysgonamonadaceae bacterium]
MSQKHYLPKAYSALSAWLITFINYLAGNLQRFGITPEEFEPVRNKAAEYNLAHIKAEEPNAGSADRLNRKKKAEEVSTETREFVNEHLRFNKNVTEEDKVNLGLTVPDPEPSPAPPPKTAPKGTVDYSKRQKHLLRVKDSHYSGRAKPDHVRGF